MPRTVTRSDRHLMRPILFFLALSLLLCGHLAAQCVSTGSGQFDVGSTWASCPPGVPGVGNTARIQAGHTVWAVADVAVDGLDVDPGGRLRVDAFGIQIELQSLNVDPGGVVYSLSGNNVYITSPQLTPLSVVNAGTIRAGDGTPGPTPGGGDVFIHDGGPGGDLPCPQGSLILGMAGSAFLGEEGGGNVYLLAQTIALDGTTVQGGSGNPPFNFLCNSTAGSVYIAGVNVSLTGGTLVEQGINGGGATPPFSCGTSFNYSDGSVKIVGQDCNTGLGTLVVDNSTVGSPLGTQCAVLFASSTTLNGATVNSSLAAGCIYWDPPNLELAGDSELAAADILIAGENLDASGLAWRTLPTPALRATDTLEIRLEAGGSLDLTGLTPGFPYFAAGSSITICGDPGRIFTDPGVDLAELMNPAPTIEPPKSTFVVTLNPGGHSLLRAGSSVEHPVQATSLSTGPAPVTLYVEDSKGWLAGGAVLVSANLDPGEAILRTLTIDVPAPAGPGDTTILKATAEIAGQAPEVSITIFEVAKDVPCKRLGCRDGGKR